VAKRGKKLSPETTAEIIQLSKEYSPKYIARHLELHESTVRRYIELDLQAQVEASQSFQKHIDDIARTLTEIVLIKRAFLTYAAFMHFTGEYPKYAHLLSSHDIFKGVTPIIKDLELFADSRSLKFCAQCPICQNIKKGLRKPA